MSSLPAATLASIPQHGAAFGLRDGRPRVRQRLLALLFLAALFHAILILGLTFNAGAVVHPDDTPALEVLLTTDDLPEARANPSAAYLAQRTQRGSGNASANTPTASPAAHAPPAGRTGAAGTRDAGATTPGEDAVLASTGAATEIRYLGSSGSTAAGEDGLPDIQAEPDAVSSNGQGDADSLQLRGQKRGELWISPDTRAALLAPYVAAWRRKVERIGTLNFPSAARSAGLSGSPVLEVAIRADGRLTEARVRRSSGFPALDQAALSILRLASPFDPFPAALAARYRTLRFAYQWEFVGGQMRSGTVTSSPDAASGP